MLKRPTSQQDRMLQRVWDALLGGMMPPAVRRAARTRPPRRKQWRSTSLSMRSGAKMVVPKERRR